MLSSSGRAQAEAMPQGHFGQTLGITHRGLDVLLLDSSRTLAVGAQQGLVTEDIDQAWYASAGAVHHRLGTQTQQGITTIAGNGDAVANVGGCTDPVQRPQLVGEYDALAQLPQVTPMLGLRGASWTSGAAPVGLRSLGE